MKETVIVAKSIANSLTNTRTRINVGTLLIGTGIGIGFGLCSIGTSLIISANIENREENCYVEEN